MKKLSDLLESELQEIVNEISKTDIKGELIKGKKYEAILEIAAKVLPLESLDEPHEFEIAGKKHVIDVAPKSHDQAQTFGEWAVNKLKNKIFDEKKASLNDRLVEKKSSTTLQIQLLNLEREGELQAYQSFAFRSGYMAEKSGKKIEYPYMPNRSLRGTIVNWQDFAKGAAWSNFEDYIESQIEELKNPKSAADTLLNKVEIINDSDLPHFESPKDKILVLHELGVSDFLKNDFDDSKLARIYMALFEFEGIDWSTIRSYIGWARKKIGDTNAIQNPDRNNKIMEELYKVGWKKKNKLQ